VSLGAREVEIRAMVPGTAVNETEIVAMTADWAGIADVTDPGSTKGTRGGPGLMPLHGGGAQTVVAKPLTNTPTVDGECNDPSTEYEGSDTGSNANMTFLIGAKSAFVYACVSLIKDTTNGGTNDWAHLLFDRDHSGETSPQVGDRLFNRTSGGGSGVFTAKKGDGSGWVDCGNSCSPDNAGYGMFNTTFGYEVYEFKISFWDVWTPGGNNTVTDTAGFAIYAFNSSGGNFYAWGSNTVNENNPATWGHLDIPEFPDVLAVGVGTVVMLALARRGRRRPRVDAACRAPPRRPRPGPAE